MFFPTIQNFLPSNIRSKFDWIKEPEVARDIRKIALGLLGLGAIGGAVYFGACPIQTKILDVSFPPVLPSLPASGEGFPVQLTPAVDKNVMVSRIAKKLITTAPALLYCPNPFLLKNVPGPRFGDRSFLSWEGLLPRRWYKSMGEAETAKEEFTKNTPSPLLLDAIPSTEDAIPSTLDVSFPPASLPASGEGFPVQLTPAVDKSVVVPGIAKEEFTKNTPSPLPLDAIPSTEDAIPSTDCYDYGSSWKAIL